MHYDTSNHDVRYDEATETYRAVHDWEGGQPVYVTVAAVLAEAVGSSTTDLEPVADRIDPDALDALFRPLREAKEGRSVDDTGSGIDRSVSGHHDAGGRRRRGDRVVVGPQSTAVPREPTVPETGATTLDGQAPSIESEPRRVGDAVDGAFVQVRLADCDVTVTWDGLVAVRPADER